MLKINDKYYIDVDNYNYILMKKHIVTEKEAEKRKKAVAGDEEYRNISFHPTLLSALKKLSEIEKKKMIIESDYHKTLGEFIKDLEKMENDFGQMLDKSCREYLKGE